MKHEENARRLLSKLEAYGLERRDEGIVNIFAMALSHRSYANEVSQSGPDIPSNERLEFLGDAVLDLVVADLLYNRYELPEGRMSTVKSAVVSEPSLAEAARKLGLNVLVCLGKGEEKTGGREKDSILADTFEAVVGAMYISFGFENTKSFVIRMLGEAIHEIVTSGTIVDHKTALQELTQALFKVLPEYRLVASEGPSHARRFTVEVWLKGDRIATASGRSKKEAQQRAAKIAYRVLKDVDKTEWRRNDDADNTG